MAHQDTSKLFMQGIHHHIHEIKSEVDLNAVSHYWSVLTEAGRSYHAPFQHMAQMTDAKKVKNKKTEKKN